MTNLDMSAISNSQWTTVNTDGTNSWNSKNIVLSNWTVTSGDVSTPPECLACSHTSRIVFAPREIPQTCTSATLSVMSLAEW